MRHKQYALCCTRSKRAWPHVDAARIKRTDHSRAGLNAEKREQVRAILHQSPRTFGQPASGWTLKRLATVCYEQGLSDTTLSCPTMLDAIVRLGVSWSRAKHWIVSPDPAYERKKNVGTA